MVLVTKVYLARDGETKTEVYHERRTVHGPLGEVRKVWTHPYADKCEDCPERRSA